MPDEQSRADGAGEQMDSELEAIQRRLKALKRRLDAREALVSDDDVEEPPPAIATGDAVEMNPLTARPQRRRSRR